MFKMIHFKLTHTYKDLMISDEKINLIFILYLCIDLLDFFSDPINIKKKKAYNDFFSLIYMLQSKRLFMFFFL